MAITFRAKAEAEFDSDGITTATSINVAKPTGTVNDDYMLAAVGVWGGKVQTAPSGWTLLAQQDVADGEGAKLSFQVYGKKAASEGSSYTFTLDRASKLILAEISSYIGVDTTQGVDAVGTLGITGTGNQIIFLTGGTVTSQCMLVKMGVGFVRTSNNSNMPTSIPQMDAHTRRYVDANNYTASGLSYGIVMTSQDKLTSGQLTTYGNALGTVQAPIPAGLLWRWSLVVALRTAGITPVATALGPPHGYNTNATLTPIFDWRHDSPNSLAQTHWSLRRRTPVGSGTWNYYTEGAGTWGTTPVFNVGNIQQFEFPSGKWTAATTYGWEIATRDSNGVDSPYSDEQTIIVNSASAIVVSLPIKLFELFSLSPIFRFDVTDVTGTRYWRAIIHLATDVIAPGFGVQATLPVYDTGEIANTQSAFQVPFHLVNGESYRLFVRVRNDDGAGTFYASDWEWMDFALNLDTLLAPVPAYSNATSGSTDGPRAKIDLTQGHKFNLLTADQSSFENFDDGWVPLTNCTFTRDTTHKTHGSWSGFMDATASATMTACTLEGKSGIPVVVGTTYRCQGSFRGFAFAASRTCRIGIRWYDSAGALITTSFSSTALVDATAFVTFTIASQAAPANSVWAAVVVEAQSVTSTEGLYVDSVFFGLSVATAFSQGGHIFGNLLPFNFAENVFGATTWSSDTIVFGSVTSLLDLSVFTGSEHTVSSSYMIPIKGGLPYSASANAKTTVSTRNMIMGIDWWDAAGEYIGSANGSTIAVTNAAGGMRIPIMTTAPTDAAFASLRIEMPSVTETERIVVDDFCFTYGQTEMYDPGSINEWANYEIEQSFDGGNTWQTSRASNPLTPVNSDLDVYDYEARVVQATHYRSRFASASYASPYTSSTSVTVTSDGWWWLKDPSDPTRSMALFIEGNKGIPMKSDHSQAKFDVMGRTDYVVVTDAYKGEEMSWKSLFFAADFDLFETLRRSLRVLFLQSEFGDQWYIKIEDRTRDIVNTNEEFQAVDVKAVEVGRPVVV